MPRIRFSLKTLFLALLFASLAGSNVFTSYRLKQLHEENVALRKETGRLVVKDPAKLNVFAVPTFEDMSWRWRVHVPEGPRQRMCLSGVRIPVHGFSGSYASTYMAPGDYLLTAIVRRNHSEKWTLTVGRPGGSISTSIDDEHGGWLEEKSGVSRGWSTSQAGQNETEVREPGETLTLLRLRVMVPAPDGKSSHTTDDPSDGILIWIDDEPSP